MVNVLLLSLIHILSHDRKYLKEVCTRLYCLTKDGLTPMEPEDLE